MAKAFPGDVDAGSPSGNAPGERVGAGLHFLERIHRRRDGRNRPARAQIGKEAG